MISGNSLRAGARVCVLALLLSAVAGSAASAPGTASSIPSSAASVASDTLAEIPVDARGLPLWESRQYSDFPVRIELAGRAELTELLARVPIADFDREQVQPFEAGGEHRLSVLTRITEAEARLLDAAGCVLQRRPDREREERRHMERMWAEQAVAGGDRLRFGDKGVYHTHAQIGAILQQTALDHPSIASFESMGTSVLGRELHMIRISANVGVEEAEPEVRLTSTMHGNEPPGLEMLLYLVEHLTDNYGIDPVVTNLIDNYEIHIMPCHNVDGLVAGNRSNANGVDLNRNFPSPDGTIGDDNTWIEEPETIAFKSYGFAHSFVISANGHSGALVVNYPWDYTAVRAPDDDALIELSLEYSTYNLPMYNGPFSQGITNGYDWYQVFGSLQDWSYEESGCIDVTLELNQSHTPPAGQLEQLWEENRESLLHYIKAAAYGVNGIVTGSDTGLPLAATVTTLGIDKSVATDPDFGDYYKLLDTGTYDLVFSAPHYIAKTVTGVSTVWGTPTVLDVVLDPAELGVIEGVVQSVAGYGLSAQIDIRTHPAGVQVATVQSDDAEDGFYSVALDYGDYLFHVTADGHIPDSRVVTVDQALESQNFLLGIAQGVVLFADDFESGTNQWTGGWGLSDDHRSPTHSMTDSPAGSYPDESNNVCAMVFDVDPTSVLAGTMSFWAHWDIEDDWDCCLLEASTDGGGSWSAVATAYTVPGSGQGAQPAGVPLFEGLQPSWVENQVDLAPWLGETALRFRFVLATDTSVREDGFYFDDVSIDGIQVVTGIALGDGAAGLGRTRLIGSVPNPFNPSTMLEYELDRPALVRILAYDLSGRRVRELVSEPRDPGRHQVQWDGRDDRGRALASGVYFYELRAGDVRDTRRVVLIR